MLLTIRTWRACCLVNTTKTCTWDCLTPANIFLDWVKLCEHNQLLFHQDKPKKSRQLIWKGRSLHPYWSHSGAGVGMPRGVLMQEDSAGWSLTVSFNSLVELANQWKPYLHFFTFFPFEVHGALQNIGNLLHYIVEKSGVFFSFFFWQIGSSFSFLSSWKWSLDFHVLYKLPQHWGSLQRDSIVLIVIGANCIGFLMSSPYYFMFSKWTFKKSC